MNGKRTSAKKGCFSVPPGLSANRRMSQKRGPCVFSSTYRDAILFVRRLTGTSWDKLSDDGFLLFRAVIAYQHSPTHPPEPLLQKAVVTTKIVD